MCRTERNSDCECGSPTLFIILGGYGAMMQQYERVCKVEAYACSEMAVIGFSVALIEALENLLHLVLWYAFTIVANREHHVFVIVTNRYDNFSSSGSIFKSVGKQVYYHFVEIGEVYPYWQVLVFMDKAELYALCP